MPAEEFAYRPPEFSPELHIVDAEWYFTASTSQSLAAMLEGSVVALLGTPTVAAALKDSQYLLIDRSPFLSERFPLIPSKNVVRSPVERSDVGGSFDAVLLDPPWYHPALEGWILQSLSFVRDGGTVVFPLLGERTRPTAADERMRLLHILSEHGEVTVKREALEYDIPLFEERALRAGGVRIDRPWRRADLVSVKVRRRLPWNTAQKPAPETGRWLTFRFGNQVIKVRRRPPVRCGDSRRVLVPIDGVRDSVLDTVSQRDPRIAQVDIWTSRNRVARTTDVAATVCLFASLSRARSAVDLIRIGRDLGLDAAETEMLLDILEVEVHG